MVGDSEIVSLLVAREVGATLVAAKTLEGEEEEPRKDEEACSKWRGSQKVELELMEEDVKHLDAMEVLPINSVD